MMNCNVIKNDKIVNSLSNDSEVLNLVLAVKNSNDLSAKEALCADKNVYKYLMGVTAKTIKYLQQAFNCYSAVNPVDYYSSAWLGFMDAVAHYDESKSSCKFTSYAYNFVKSQVSEDWLKDMGYTATAKGQYLLSHSSLEDLLEFLGSDDNADTSFLEFASPEKETMRKQLEKALKKAFDSLPEVSKEIVERCYGLFGYDVATRKEVAYDMDLTENVINELLNAAIVKLKGVLESYGYGKGDVGLLAA